MLLGLSDQYLGDFAQFMTDLGCDRNQANELLGKMSCSWTLKISQI